MARKVGLLAVALGIAAPPPGTPELPTPRSENLDRPGFDPEPAGLRTAAATMVDPAYWAADGAHPTEAGHALTEEEGIRMVCGE